MSSNITPCRCSMAAEALILENATTVPAGSVSNGLSVCGYETELNRLPNISFENQVYAEGFCPDAALAVGTLYPDILKAEDKFPTELSCAEHL